MILNAVSVVVLTWDLSLIFFIVQQKAKKKLLNYKRNLWKIKEKNTFQVMDIEWMTRRLFWEKIKLSALINWYTEVFIRFKNIIIIKNEVFYISSQHFHNIECKNRMRPLLKEKFVSKKHKSSTAVSSNTVTSLFTHATIIELSIFLMSKKLKKHNGFVYKIHKVR